MAGPSSEGAPGEVPDYGASQVEDPSAFADLQPSKRKRSLLDAAHAIQQSAAAQSAAGSEQLRSVSLHAPSTAERQHDSETMFRRHSSGSLQVDTSGQLALGTPESIADVTLTAAEISAATAFGMDLQAAKHKASSNNSSDTGMQHAAVRATAAMPAEQLAAWQQSPGSNSAAYAQAGGEEQKFFPLDCNADLALVKTEPMTAPPVQQKPADRRRQLPLPSGAADAAIPRRVIANRQSAARSKERRRGYVIGLEQNVKRLTMQVSEQQSHLHSLAANSANLGSANQALASHAAGLEEKLRTSESEMSNLRAECERLRSVVMSSLSGDAALEGGASGMSGSQALAPGGLPASSDTSGAPVAPFHPSTEAQSLQRHSGAAAPAAADATDAQSWEQFLNWGAAAAAADQYGAAHPPSSSPAPPPQQQLLQQQAPPQQLQQQDTVMADAPAAQLAVGEASASAARPPAGADPGGLSRKPSVQTGDGPPLRSNSLRALSPGHAAPVQSGSPMLLGGGGHSGQLQHGDSGALAAAAAGGVSSTHLPPPPLQPPFDLRQQPHSQAGMGGGLQWPGGASSSSLGANSTGLVPGMTPQQGSSGGGDFNRFPTAAAAFLHPQPTGPFHSSVRVQSDNTPSVAARNNSFGGVNTLSAPTLPTQQQVPTESGAADGAVKQPTSHPPLDAAEIDRLVQQYAAAAAARVPPPNRVQDVSSLRLASAHRGMQIRIAGSGGGGSSTSCSSATVAKPQLSLPTLGAAAGGLQPQQMQQQPATGQAEAAAQGQQGQQHASPPWCGASIMDDPTSLQGSSGSGQQFNMQEMADIFDSLDADPSMFPGLGSMPPSGAA